VAGSALPLSTSLFAQPAFPTQTVKLVVPAAAGGVTDLLTRLMGEKLQPRIGQPVITENRTGAAGIVGMETVAKAPADGHTLVMGYIGVMAVNPWLYKDLPYDPVRDFAPVALIATFPMILAVNASVPANTVQELVTLMKQKSGQLNYGSGGTATTSHLAMELFLRETGTKAQHVPYKGGALAMNDLIGGHISAAFDTLPAVLPHVRSGKVKALGIASSKPSELVPNLPTIAATVPGFEVSGWCGLLARSGTPASTIALLSKELIASVNDPDTLKVLASRGMEPMAAGPEEFAKLIREENQKWKRVVQEANIKAD
jgi:tripartite-type tricarboxylate transporter receptor subunit TctC